MSSQSRILMLYTGGTIGMVRDLENDSLIPFNFQYLLDKIPEISQLDCEIHTDSLDKPIDSSNIKPEHWLRLSDRIFKDYNNYDGFVILHGSDTMAYTASALSFSLQNLQKPVILTGSQLPIGVARSDARENLLTTIEIAMARTADGKPKIPEVAVYFEYDLFRGNRTHKISTEDFEAFQSLNYPKLAEAGVNIKYREDAIMKPPAGTFSVAEKFSDEIGELTVFPGISPEFVKAVLKTENMKVLLLRTFGSGNAPMDDWFLNLLSEAIQAGLLIVNVSQCNGGGVHQGKYEASKGLREMGVISAGDMTFEATLTKAMYLLPLSNSYESFKLQFETNLRGEKTAEY